MSGLLTGTAFTNQFPEINTTTGNGSDSLQGLVVAIYEIGCFAGSLFCLFAGEKLGRKNCIWLGCFILTIGAVLQTTAYGIPQMIVGRIVAGVGNGINTSTIVGKNLNRMHDGYLTDDYQPVWHAELMQAHKRGKGLSIEFAINIFGVSWEKSNLRVDRAHRTPADELSRSCWHTGLIMGSRTSRVPLNFGFHWRCKSCSLLLQR